MKDDYEIGYGKPPKATQFGKRPQPTRSLNRQSASPKVSVEVEHALNRPFNFNKDGVQSRVHPHEAIMLGLANQALGGNLRAARLFISSCRKAGMFDAETGTTGFVTVPLSVTFLVGCRLIATIGIPPWSKKIIEQYEEEYRCDCLHILQLLEQEKRKRNG